jgi:uncharacterized protein YqgV (UPF0045/DUF77 family)
MFKIFLCHRSSDAGYAASHIYQELTEVFGEENVFEYNDAMPAGVNFRQHVIAQLQQMQVFVPLIGPQWLDCRDDNGAPRLMQFDDPVRVEIEAALDMPTLRILPVFLHGIASLPKSKLPPSMSRLIDISAIHIGQKPQELKKGVNRLIEAIRTAGIHPRLNPNIEIKKVKNELLELEDLIAEKQFIYLRKRKRRNTALISLPISIITFFVCLFTQSDTLYFLCLLSLLVFFISLLGFILSNPKRIKKHISDTKKMIITTKSRLIELEGKSS